MLLIRHARAGDRHDWVGDDRRRPLDRRGRAQAEALPELLGDFRLERILSSPADRCRQTVEVLARTRRIDIELCDELGEDRQEGDGAALVRRLLGTPVAISCHGGLSEAVTGESQKKAETLVLDERGRVVERLRPG